MVTQQVVGNPARAAVFLVFTIRPGGEDTVRDLLADVSGLTRAVGFRVPDDILTTVVGIGAEAWDRLFSAPRPASLHPFIPLDGGRHVAPATPGDLLLHVRARHTDTVFELARQVSDRLAGATDIVDETHGFKYFDERDLLGFVDGTENPEGTAATEAVLIGDEDPDYRGGSYVIVQKYLHDMSAWNALSAEEQERVIGRTKLEDIELPDDVKPTNSHVALNTIVDEHGVEHDIVRENMPFGSFGAKEFGTYFIGYAADPSITEQMLSNMFIGNPRGNTDRILDFSTAITGSLFFIPTVEFLDDPPPGPEPVPDAAPESEPSNDSSLGIGGLRPPRGTEPSHQED